jgi:hypothetical protein
MIELSGFSEYLWVFQKEGENEPLPSSRHQVSRLGSQNFYKSPMDF